jgi:hypothetical protein
MTISLSEAIEQLLVIGVSAYLDGGSRNERLRAAVEAAIQALDQWDAARRGLSHEQVNLLLAWAQNSPGEEGLQ